MPQEEVLSRLVGPLVCVPFLNSHLCHIMLLSCIGGSLQVRVCVRVKVCVCEFVIDVLKCWFYLTLSLPLSLCLSAFLTIFISYVAHILIPTFVIHSIYPLHPLPFRFVSVPLLSQGV